MPKGRAKRKRDKGVVSTDSLSPDEDSESVCSSHDGSVMSEDGGGVMVGGEEEIEEDLEFKLGELIDNLSDKSSRTRLEAISSISRILSMKVVTHNLLGRKETVIDTIARGLKKVSGKERCDLLRLAMLLTVQFGMEHPELLIVLKPLVIELAQDHSVGPVERGECVHLLGVASFIQTSDLLEVEHSMRICEDLFRKSKHDNLVASAVKSWTLLLSIAPTHIIPSLFQSLVPILNTLLEKSDTTVRLAVGQAVALLFELARESDEDLVDSSDAGITYSLIEQLATESNRYTARKDRNQQRALFRDVLQTLDDGSVPERLVKVGVERVSLDSWARLVQYNAFRDLLGSGMTLHIQNNELLRDIFQMGPPPLVTAVSKASKLEKKYTIAAMAKQRSQMRGKQRDKRAVL